MQKIKKFRDTKNTVKHVKVTKHLLLLRNKDQLNYADIRLMFILLSNNDKELKYCTTVIINKERRLNVIRVNVEEESFMVSEALKENQLNLNKYFPFEQLKRIINRSECLLSKQTSDSWRIMTDSLIR